MNEYEAGIVTVCIKLTTRLEGLHPDCFVCQPDPCFC